MKRYEIKDFTYGVELEYGNCDRTADLPDGAVWNSKDNTCVSSTGIANDPKGILYKYGGEINTRPTDTIKEQIEHIELINKKVKSIVNYRSNLHVHIRVPGLKDDLEKCKKLLTYINLYQKEAFYITETIPKPDPSLDKDKYFAALQRMKRNYKSHQATMSVNRVKEMMAATTTKEFYEAHAPLTKMGRMWYFSPRAGINLRQMWEDTETIEFRHFPGTKNMKEMESAIRWCQNFLDFALNHPMRNPMQLMQRGKYQFPKFKPFEFETEKVYQFTNFDKNNRGEVEKRLKLLREKIDIDNLKTTSRDVFKIVRKL